MPAKAISRRMMFMIEVSQEAKKVEEKTRRFPPCRKACPANVNIQGYIALIQRGKFKEAVDVIRNDMPFPAICGRVCFSPCEEECSRTNIDQAVNIRNLKRVAADIEREVAKPNPKPIPIKHDERLAIVGAGPAGLTVAYELVRLGYPVTVFERMAEPGGMMRYCIPDFRLERSVVADEIAYIQGLGVEIRTNVEFGKDITLESLGKEGYKAVFLAVGTQEGMRLGVPGEDLKGVMNAVDFLRDVALGKKVTVGDAVAVVGGGNSAIDSARTAKRLGAKDVMVLYRRSREEMPALPSEVADAERDGVKFHFLVNPKQIIEDDGKVKAVECLRMQLGEPDASGRRRPIPVSNSEHQYVVNCVIPALGQLANASSIPKAVIGKDSRIPLIAVDNLTLETRLPGIFAGGDVVTGSASIIEAVGAGKRAAISINRYLTGKDLHQGRENIDEVTWVKSMGNIKKKESRFEPFEHQQPMKMDEIVDYLETIERNATFEACRCLGCGPCEECLEGIGLCEPDKAVVEEDLCVGCNICASVCPFGAIAKDENNIAKVDELLCKGCGICATRCPAQAISLKELTNERLITLTLMSGGMK
ncbi:MAG: heterodisulfide reductase subunit [Thermoproteota archaeon]|nr:heterodisulfide reductase subunit [Thermoproteota archaeon]